MNENLSTKLLTAQGEDELKEAMWEMLQEGEECVADVYMSLGDAVSCNSGVIIGCANDVMCKLVSSVNEEVRRWARGCLTEGRPSQSTVAHALQMVHEALEETSVEPPQEETLFPSLSDTPASTIPISQNPAVLWHAFHFLASFPLSTHTTAVNILLAAAHAKGYLGPETSQTHPVITEARHWFLTSLIAHLPPSAVTSAAYDKIISAVLPTNLPLLCTFLSRHPSLTTAHHVNLVFEACESVDEVLPLAALSSNGTAVSDLVCTYIWSRFDEVKAKGDWMDIGVKTFAASVQTILKQVLKWSDLMASWYSSVLKKGVPPPEPDFQLRFPQITSLITGLAEAWDTLPPAATEQLASSTLPLAALFDADAIEMFLEFTRLHQRMPADYTSKPIYVLRQLLKAIDTLASKALASTDSAVLRVAYILAPQYKLAHAAATNGADAGDALVETAKADDRGQQWIGVALRACCAMDDDTEQSDYDSDVRLAVFFRAATGILHGITKGLSPFLDSKYVGEVLQSSQRCMGFWLRMKFPFATVMVAASQIKPGAWSSAILRCIASAETAAEAEAWAVTIANLADLGAFSSSENRKLFTRVVGRHANALTAINTAVCYTPTAERLVAWCKGEEYKADTAPKKAHVQVEEEFRPQYTLGILDDDDDDLFGEGNKGADKEGDEEETVAENGFEFAVPSRPKGKADFLVDMAAHMATPRRPRKTVNTGLIGVDKNLRKVAMLSGASSQVQIDVQPCGAAWVTDNKPKESKPIKLVEDNITVQPKQFNSSALAAGDMRFKAMQDLSRAENIRQLRERRLPGHKAVILQALLEAQVPAGLAKKQLPALPVSYVSEDHYAKSLWPYIVEEAACGVQRAMAEMKFSIKDKGMVTEVLNRTEEIVMEFQQHSSNYYGPMDVVAMDCNTDKLILGKVTKYYPRHNQLQVSVTKAELSSMHVNRPIEVTPLTRVGTVFHQNWAINHLAMFPLYKTLLGAAPITTPFEGYQNVVPSGYLAYLGRRFNHVQQSAILKAASYTEGITLIQGPPGTGKTHTIVGLLGMLLMHNGPLTCPRHKRVLVVAPSNTAIDEVALRVAKTGLRDCNGEMYSPKMVRVGVRSKVNDELKPLFMDDIVELQLGVKRGQADKANDGYVLLRNQIEGERVKLDKIENKLSVEYVNQAEKIRLMEGRLKTELAKRKIAAEVAEESRQMTKAKVLEKAQLVFSTLGSCKDLTTKFSAVVIDEAAQAVEPDVLVALSCGAKVCVMVGDDKQLPATVLSPKAQAAGYDRSLFARLRQGGHEPMLLSTQYRMHPEIRAFPSKAFYSGKLSDHPSLLKRPEVPILPYFIVNVPNGRTLRKNKSSSLMNEVEARVVDVMVQKVRAATQMNNSDIGVISPYKDQVDVIRRRLPGVEVNTVDGYQGREKKVIVVSCVRAPGAAVGLGFTNKEERVNVSLTRGQSVVIVVCHIETMASDALWRSLIVDARQRELVFEAESFLEFGRPLPGSKGALKAEDLQHDTTKVRNNVCLEAAKKEAARKKKLAEEKSRVREVIDVDKVAAKPRVQQQPMYQGVTGGFAASISRAAPQKRSSNQPIPLGKRVKR
eukprot:TRINITY_DN3153_c0_g1_i2.p1 TRINITY_DN3153_c0_g1~~TRINITY_DN3153_c0_g1_i2.p1  ORF type:complete len:1584 (+),score=490.59 TRINITY_DN3153_c0_g1_i2:48-4799(+)